MNALPALQEDEKVDKFITDSNNYDQTLKICVVGKLNNVPTFEQEKQVLEKLPLFQDISRMNLIQITNQLLEWIFLFVVFLSRMEA